MTIETEVAALTTATTALLTAVNVGKATLDQKVTDATAQADLATTNGAAQVALATTQANAASSNAGIATTQNTAAGVSAGAAASSATQSAAARDLAIAAWNASMSPAETLPVISKSLHIGAIVQAIIYDTSKDSDGGAWRKRCADKSWYTETLGGDRWIGQQATIAAAWTAAGSATGAVFQATATAGPLTAGKYYAATSPTTATEIFRGISREFPEQVAIVAEIARVVIYDLTQVGTPMWMVFVGNAVNMLWIQPNIASIAALNGRLYVGEQSWGLVYINFISEESWAYAGSRHYRGNISKRNDGLNVDVWGGYEIGNTVNDIAITILDGAPIDPTTGLPVPTIYAFTAGGVSRISDAGTVSSTASTACTSGWIEGNYAYASDGALVGGWKTDTALPTGGASAINAYWTALSYSATTVPAIWPTAPTLVKGTNGAVGHALGLTKIKHNPASTTLGMIATITNTIPGMWQIGDSRGAWLADTVAETITDSDVTNGGFDTDTSWTKTQFEISGGVATDLSSTNGYITQISPFTLAVGKTVQFTFTLVAHTTGYAYIFVAGTNTNLPEMFGTPGTYTRTITISNVTDQRVGILTGNGPSGIVIDNISCKLAEPDRSVKANGLIVNGSLTKSAVASGANLMAYSGFSAANYLEQPFSANHDYSTTGFSGHFWLKENPNSAIEYLLNRDSATPAQAIRLWVSAAGFLVFELYDGTTTRTATGTVAVDDSTWKFVAFTYLAGTLNLYVNGVLYATATGAALLTLSNAAAVLRVGVDVAGSYPTLASLALVRLTATVVSTDQISHVYRTELPLFQTNAKCTIDGTSTAVSAKPDYDESTDLLHVPTSWGRSAFKDLLRTESEATTTGALTSLSANQGAILTGGTSAKYYQPAMLLRDELRRKDEARKALGKVPVFIEFDAVTSQVAFVVTKGYTVKAVYSAGTLKRVGSTKDYTISNDGFQETITFAVAPGNGVWVSALCVRSN